MIDKLNSYIGRTVAVTKEDVSYTSSFSGKTSNLTSYSCNDPLLDEIREQAKPNKIRIILPGRMYTMDYRLDRINIQISQTDEEWKIDKIYFG